MKELGKTKKGVATDVLQLKRHQFKKGRIPWNKGVTGYTVDKSWREDPEKVKKHSEAVSRAKTGKPNLSSRGKNSHFWKGGTSDLRDRIESSYKYREWRKSVFSRDEYICRKCGKGGYIEAHHKKGFAEIISENNIKTPEESLECEELWNISNGETLCLKCHTREGRPNSSVRKMQLDSPYKPI